ncbi:MAG: DNA repair ATPase [Aquimonas sp.]|nr:DNA repair ATPase [Aquimonas sp.]
MTTPESLVDQAVAEGGAYEVLRARLLDQGGRLRGLAEGLNRERLEEFGTSELKIIGRLRVRTEHNAVARDLVRVGDYLLFGYNVFLGLKRETRVEDVFALHRLVEVDDGFDVEQVDLAASFLGAQGFVQDFRELYAYYKNTRLLQLVARDGLLLAAFQIGERLSDLRVFRFSVSPAGEVRYIDNRGERDIELPPIHDFEWTRCGREHVVEGRFPHMNVLDQVFVETLGGDLTIKIENNTQDGLGIYREPVDDATQSIDDARIDFARVGDLILLRVLPYREERARYFVYSVVARRVYRIDAIGLSCVQLPEDHGIVYPGGYVLQNGEQRSFERSMEGMRFKRSLRSPNGEDVLYVFYEPSAGRMALFTYNLIDRRLATPLFGHGHARLEDGRFVLFSQDSEEPTRVHPMQVWQTPFWSEEFAAARPPATSFMGRIGNAELVRGISDLLSLVREIESEEVSATRYSLLGQNCRRLFDLHHWLDSAECAGVAPLVREISGTAETVLDEFEKVESIRAQSERSLREARSAQTELLARSRPERCESVNDYVEGLSGLQTQRGRLLALREARYMDLETLDALEAQVVEAQQRLSTATGEFLASAAALKPLDERLRALDAEAGKAQGVVQLKAPLEGMAQLSLDLDLLSNLLAGLPIEDAQQRTQVVETISELYARLNQARARADQQRRSLGSREAVAQFGAQFALFGQSLASALSLSTDPERSEEQLSRVLLQLEELESRFGEHEQFLQDILGKREEVLETFESHRQALLDERQRRAQGLHEAALRIFEGLSRRTERLQTVEALHGFFAGDALILKLRELSGRLRDLHDSVKAEDIEARLKAARDAALRGQRDRSELFEDGGNTIRLGPRHRFSVNTQVLDLTLLPRGGELCLHLTGTEYYEPAQDEELARLRVFADSTLESESAEVGRAEYLAASLFEAARSGIEGQDLTALKAELADPDALARRLREFAASRYREGYEKGIHDSDAARILAAWLPLREAAGTLIFPPAARALAALAWLAQSDRESASLWPLRARQARQLIEALGQRGAAERLGTEIAAEVERFRAAAAIELPESASTDAARYLVELLGEEHPQFVFSAAARQLVQGLKARLATGHRWEDLQAAAEALSAQPGQALGLWLQWFDALCEEPDFAELREHAIEAAALMRVEGDLPTRISEVDLAVDIKGLLSTHARIEEGRMRLRVDDFEARLRRHRETHLPGLRAFQARRHSVIESGRARLRLEEFKPRPLTSFVRNKLISEVYLPIIGDNLAKQMGTVGEGRRSDLMGLLMLISPPGYGKTTLMEYVAHALGLIFMKINGPSLGHEVRSLDPTQAPDAGARQELEKLNLALEMGNNVMLYVDDIQHTHPEFLQKFISLCDGTRRIEGVWQGRTRTYDMRGKKFCVVMAGNPYTESGEVFKIPDMLANRADVYNLGEVLGGKEDAFLLSYVENCLTAQPVLAPLATRDLNDLYKLVERAQGREFSANALSHTYSAAELNELTAVLKNLLAARDIVYRVNQAYIASAAQAEAYRTEPPFKLQGSYRNMNKLAEKMSSVMNAAELQKLIDDHYLGESQLLTGGAEENLLKLAEIRGTLDPARAERWQAIKQGFQRNKALGGADSDTGTRVIAQLHDLVASVRTLGERAGEATPAQTSPELIQLLQRILDEQVLGRTFSRDTATDAAMWLGGLRNALEVGFRPLVEAVQAREGLRESERKQWAELAKHVGELSATLAGKPRG